MSNKKIPIALRHPDKIMLHYGSKQIELKISQDFNKYIVTVDEDELKDLEPYLAKGESI